MTILKNFKLGFYRQILVIFSCICLSLILFPNIASAGFGISPPEVKSDKLYPGSQYEQLIMLLRSSAEDELVAQVTINSPEIESWVTIDKGNEFTLPKGSLQVPMIVHVDVPEDAEVGSYQGHINVRVAPKGQEKGSGVAIALGARIEIKLVVTKEKFTDFKVRLVTFPDIETLNKPWNWKIFSWFFYRVKLIMKIENLGNIPIAPSKVALEIWDVSERNLLESSEDTKFELVPAFQTKDNVVASFPTNLEVGNYWARFKIYKDNEIVYKDKLAFSVLPYGKLPGGTDLGIWPYVIIGSTIVISLIILFILIKIKIWVKIYKLFLIICWPLFYIYKKTVKFWKILKFKFWQWMHKKSEKYQNDIKLSEESNTDKEFNEEKEE